MFSFLKKDPTAKLNKQYTSLLEQALEAQKLASKIDELKAVK